MHPQLQRREAFSVAGLTVRTCNSDERDPQSARIGQLWDREPCYLFECFFIIEGR